MFKKLTDFSYKRTGKEAFGFYLAYFVLGLLIGGLSGALSSVFSNATTFQEGYATGSTMGPIVGVFYITIISLLILIKRKLYRRFRYIILIVVNCLIAFIGGALLGLIIPAFMTTRETPSQE